jgi:hypothetical protein
MMRKRDEQVRPSLQSVACGDRPVAGKLPGMAEETSQIEMKKAITHLSAVPRRLMANVKTPIDATTAVSRSAILNRILFDVITAAAQAAPRKPNGVIVAGPAARLAASPIAKDVLLSALSD